MSDPPRSGTNCHKKNESLHTEIINTHEEESRYPWATRIEVRCPVEVRSRTKAYITRCPRKFGALGQIVRSAPQDNPPIVDYTCEDIEAVEFVISGTCTTLVVFLGFPDCVHLCVF